MPQEKDPCRSGASFTLHGTASQHLLRVCWCPVGQTEGSWVLSSPDACAELTEAQGVTGRFDILESVAVRAGLFEIKEDSRGARRGARHGGLA